ncbi:MAG: AI-2E family transporter [Planctomycetota bacterium]
MDPNQPSDTPREPHNQPAPDPPNSRGSAGAADVSIEATSKPTAADQVRRNLMSVEGPYVWQRRWFNLLLAAILMLVVIGLLLPVVSGLIDKSRPVLNPLLLGLALAYIFNPAVEWAHRQYGLSRLTSASVLLGGALLLLLATFGVALPVLIKQTVQLAENTPQYLQAVLDWVGVDKEELLHRAQATAGRLTQSDIDFGAVAQGALQALSVGGTAVLGVLGWLTGTALLLVVAALCFFVFLWKLDKIKTWSAAFFPASHREDTFTLLRKMDRSVSAYIRGRLIQAFILSLILTVGWGAVGVPYWLLLGLLGGVLGLLPYIAVIAWPVAVGLAVLDATTGAIGGEATQIDWLWDVIAPTVVYGIAQLVDGWVVEPIVQGKATDLDPLTVLLVVLAGGAIAGLIGLILAIPVAACVKILMTDVALPRLRELAAEN